MARLAGEHALVLGGSIGGLLAARALSPHFRRVTVLERDELAAGPQARQGTPHARHTHGLLAHGLEAIEQMLPGTCVELDRHGASQADLAGQCRWHIGGGWLRQAPSGLVGSGQSRLLLEWVVRQRVARISNISLRDKISADRLQLDEAGRRIVGVSITDRRTNTGETLPADLVIDATGRGSRLPAWLGELGFRRPAEEKVEVDLMYVTRLYRRRDGDFEGNMAVITAPTPPNKRFAAAVKQEGERWSVTLGGMLGDHPPADEAGMLEFARGLPVPDFHRFLQSAEPLGESVTYRFPASIRRRYERLRWLPEGIVPLGDSICSFNPVYGQGMTVAALEARLLGDLLADGSTRLAQRFLRGAAAIIDIPWQIAAGSDLRFGEVRGRRGLALRAINSYIDRVHRAARHDAEVAKAFHRVANLLTPPGSLFHPSILKRVLWPAASSGTATISEHASIRSVVAASPDSRW